MSPPDDNKGVVGSGGKEELPDDNTDNKAGPEVSFPRELSPELLESLPDEVREVVLQAAFSGPLPPPAMFGEYDDVLPGAADRILAMAERQAAHRQEWEISALRSEQKDSTRGQWLGFLISLGALIAATYLTVDDHVVAPILLVGVGLSGLAASFINAVRRGRSNEEGVQAELGEAVSRTQPIPKTKPGANKPKK